MTHPPSPACEKCGARTHSTDEHWPAQPEACPNTPGHICERCDGSEPAQPDGTCPICSEVTGSMNIHMRMKHGPECPPGTFPQSGGGYAGPTEPERPTQEDLDLATVRAVREVMIADGQLKRPTDWPARRDAVSEGCARGLGLTQSVLSEEIREDSLARLRDLCDFGFSAGQEAAKLRYEQELDAWRRKRLNLQIENDRLTVELAEAKAATRLVRLDYEALLADFKRLEAERDEVQRQWQHEHTRKVDLDHDCDRLRAELVEAKDANRWQVEKIEREMTYARKAEDERDELRQQCENMAYEIDVAVRGLAAKGIANAALNAALEAYAKWRDGK
jgi:hypothetical protein